MKPFVTKGVTVMWENRNHLDLFFKTKFGKYKDKDIRFSMSGLFRIQIPGTNKYLLVFNRRITNQLQSVGGAYKRFGDDHLFNEWGFRPDSAKNGLDVDERSDADLRFTVKGKHVVDVLNWFESGREREIDAKREFIEELLDTNILDKNVFQHFNTKHIRRYSHSLSWSDHFSCFEILTFDVFELLPNEEQKRHLLELTKRDLSETLPAGYAVVHADDIEQLRFMHDGNQVARIGRHTKLIINQNF